MGNTHVLPQCNRYVCSEPQSSQRNPDWMKKLNDEAFISSISIPGTHQSLSLHGEPTLFTAKLQCQSWSLYNQLEAGLRCFDIRVKNCQGKLYIYHSIIYQKLDFMSCLEQMDLFLKENPSEAIIVKLKEESANDQNQMWFIENRIPKLKEVRGKVFLMRQFYGDFAFPYEQMVNPNIEYQVSWTATVEQLLKNIKQFFLPYKQLKAQKNG